MTLPPGTKNTQCARLAQYLRDHRQITCIEAGRLLNISFVGRRIYDLKRLGWVFRDRMVKRQNAMGEDIQVKLYVVQEEGAPVASRRPERGDTRPPRGAPPPKQRPAPCPLKSHLVDASGQTYMA